ncbi:MAG TPA: CHAT domain-containing protein, partial [Acidobacteriota bacterium]
RIHFASHGLIDEEKPEFSALVLSSDEKGGEDGYLTMREVFDLKLNADLVVLSACKTGLGKEVRGEGVTGISRAFLCAGTPSVLVSLWDVYDRSTADFMASFYKNMETKNMNKSAALREARLQMIASKKFSHPYYWAPFVLIGNK